jgi:hypothetical protein
LKYSIFRSWDTPGEHQITLEGEGEKSGDKTKPLSLSCWGAASFYLPIIEEAMVNVKSTILRTDP